MRMVVEEKKSKGKFSVWLQENNILDMSQNPIQPPSYNC